MSIREVEEMTKRARAMWKYGCRDRNVAEYSTKLIEATRGALGAFDNIAVTFKELAPAMSEKLTPAMERLRVVLYGSFKSENEEDEKAKAEAKESPKVKAAMGETE